MNENSWNGRPLSQKNLTGNRLRFQQAQLAAQSDLLESVQPARELFEYALHVLRKSIDAYCQHSEHRIIYSVPPIPEIIPSDSFASFGFVHFDEEIAWQVTPSRLGKSCELCFRVSRLVDPETGYRSLQGASFHMEVDKDNKIRTYAYGSYGAIPELRIRSASVSDKAAVATVMKKLLETQLLISFPEG